MVRLDVGRLLLAQETDTTRRRQQVREALSKMVLLFLLFQNIQCDF